MGFFYSFRVTTGGFLKQTNLIKIAVPGLPEKALSVVFLEAHLGANANFF